MDSSGSKLRRTVELLERSRPHDPIEAERVAAAVEARLFRDLGRETTLRTFGRYVLLERLGRGGAGLVHAAYDPELERKVAIKLLVPRRTNDDASQQARARLIREARAAARLSHPNVVTVHDVGTYDPGAWGMGHASPRDNDDAAAVYIVMELVRGHDLRVWQQRERPTWRVILDTYVAAGRGLAAAHGRGLIHRDFKPTNVLIDDDGHVKVLDFGLARGIANDNDDDTPSAANGESLPSATGSFDAQLTEAGAIVGTPAYMSPEQHASTAATARSDQYSFAMALFEALHGELPFAGQSHDELAQAKRRGVIATGRSRVPTFVTRALSRALQPEPADRFPDMNALLDALTRRRAKRAQALSLVAVAVVAVATTAGVDRATDSGRDVCEDMDGKLLEHWDDAIRQRAEQAFIATGPHARQTWSTVATALDEYVAAWSTARRETCESTLLRGDKSVQQMSRSLLCLDAQLSWVGGLTRTFERADVSTAAHAVQAVHALPSPQSCLHPASDPDAATTPATHAVLAIESQLGLANALQYAAKYDEARTVLQQARTDARTLGDPTTLARTSILAGRVEQRQGDYATAEDSYWEALSWAERAHHDQLALDAMLRLVVLIGDNRARPDEAIRLAGMARARAARAGLGHGLEARLAHALGRVYERAGRFDEAVAALERAHALATTHESPDALFVGDVENMLGVVLDRISRYRRAKDHFSRSATQRARTLGEMHPDTVTARINVAIMRGYLGEYEASVNDLEVALAQLRTSLGERHPLVAWFTSALGYAYELAGRLDDAEQTQLDALAIRRATLGPEHPEVGVSLRAAAHYRLLRDDPHAALPLATEATRIARVHDDSARTAVALQVLGRTYLALGRHDDAEAQVSEALALARQHLGDAHNDTAYAWQYAAEVALARGEWSTAHDRATKSRAVWEAIDHAPLDLAAIEYLLARTSLPTDPAGAVALARGALATYDAIGPNRTERDTIAAFVATHER